MNSGYWIKAGAPWESLDKLAGSQPTSGNPQTGPWLTARRMQSAPLSTDPSSCPECQSPPKSIKHEYVCEKCGKCKWVESQQPNSAAPLTSD